MRSALACLAFLAPSSALAAGAQDARPLFLLHCASCHGETGDGKGTATLDRPARSFRDGGFSYGNTPEALLRTITQGIPGTPMPAAPSVLTEADRRALADYVLSLGPPTETATIAESTLVVRDRPLVARGKLPPVGPDLPERPRGLLIGTLDGLSFEYRTDDVRLLCVRQGAFADRRDWRGRGGDVLQPLGVPIHRFGSGDPGPTVRRGDRTVFVARLDETFVEGDRAGLRYRLVAADDPAALATVEESARAVVSPAGSGFERDFSLRGAGIFRLRVGEPGPRWLASGTNWVVRAKEDGVVEAIGTTERSLDLVGGAVEVPVDLGIGARRRVFVRTLLLPAWNPEVEASWLAEMRR
jgi:mono/diheme cytochrome c family protein